MKFFIQINEAGAIANTNTIKRVFNGLLPGWYMCDIVRGKKRSNLQNRYFHGCVLPLVLDGLRVAGYNEVKTLEDTKTVLKSLFLKSVMSNGIEDIPIIRDTHQLSTIQFLEFIADIQKWSATYLGVIIPDPSTQTELNYFEQT